MPLQVNMLWCLRISPVIDLHGDHGKRAGEGGQGGWLRLTASSGGGEVPLAAIASPQLAVRLRTELIFKTTLPCSARSLHAQASTRRC